MNADQWKWAKNRTFKEETPVPCVGCLNWNKCVEGYACEAYAQHMRINYVFPDAEKEPSRAIFRELFND